MQSGQISGQLDFEKERDESQVSEGIVRALASSQRSAGNLVLDGPPPSIDRVAHVSGWLHILIRFIFRSFKTTS